MAQNLPEIGRLPNLGVKMDKNVYKNRESPSKIGRVGISAVAQDPEKGKSGSGYTKCTCVLHTCRSSLCTLKYMQPIHVMMMYAACHIRIITA